MIAQCPARNAGDNASLPKDDPLAVEAIDQADNEDYEPVNASWHSASEERPGDQDK
jgi:hypothetical protein